MNNEILKWNEKPCNIRPAGNMTMIVVSICDDHFYNRKCVQYMFICL